MRDPEERTGMKEKRISSYFMKANCRALHLNKIPSFSSRKRNKELNYRNMSTDPTSDVGALIGLSGLDVLYPQSAKRKD